MPRRRGPRRRHARSSTRPITATSSASAACGGSTRCTRIRCACRWCCAGRDASRRASAARRSSTCSTSRRRWSARSAARRCRTATAASLLPIARDARARRGATRVFSRALHRHRARVDRRPRGAAADGPQRHVEAHLLARLRAAALRPRDAIRTSARPRERPAHAQPRRACSRACSTAGTPTASPRASASAGATRTIARCMGAQRAPRRRIPLATAARAQPAGHACKRCHAHRRPPAFLAPVVQLRQPADRRQRVLPARLPAGRRRARPRPLRHRRRDPRADLPAGRRDRVADRARGRRAAYRRRHRVGRPRRRRACDFAALLARAEGGRHSRAAAPHRRRRVRRTPDAWSRTSARPCDAGLNVTILAEARHYEHLPRVLDAPAATARSRSTTWACRSPTSIATRGARAMRDVRARAPRRHRAALRPAVPVRRALARAPTRVAARRGARHPRVRGG